MTVKYVLKKPIRVGEGEPVTELSFREEVVAGDVRGVPMRDPMLFDDLLKIAGRLCAQTDAVMNKMAFIDLMEVAPLVAGFIGVSPPTGSEHLPS